MSEPARGQTVVLDTAHGERTRRIVRVHSDIVEITRQEEWEAAVREGRPPITIGFRKSDILHLGRIPPIPGDP